MQLFGGVIIRRAAAADDAERLTAEFLASQYGVRKVLVEVCANIAQEVYLSNNFIAPPLPSRFLLQLFGGVINRVDNFLIAGTAAKVS